MIVLNVRSEIDLEQGVFKEREVKTTLLEGGVDLDRVPTGPCPGTQAFPSCHFLERQAIAVEGPCLSVPCGVYWGKPCIPVLG